MKNLIVSAIAALFFGNASAFTTAFNSSKDIYALGSVEIAGSFYDVSTNGAFGTVDTIDLGLNPLNAAQSIAAILNLLGDSNDPRKRWPFPTLANDTTTRFQVKASNSFGYSGFYGAGWVCCSLQGIDTGSILSFRVAIPNAIPDTPTLIPGVPEPESYAMLLAGLAVIAATASHREKR